MKAQLLELVATVAEETRSIESLQSSSSSLSSQLRNLLSELESARKDLEELNEAERHEMTLIQSARDSNSSLQANLDKAKDSISSMSHVLSVVRENSSRLNDQENTFKEMTESLQRENQSVESQIRDLESSYIHCLETVRLVEAQKAAKIKDLRKVLNETLDKTMKMQLECEDIRSKNRKLDESLAIAQASSVISETSKIGGRLEDSPRRTDRQDFLYIERDQLNSFVERAIEERISIIEQSVQLKMESRLAQLEKEIQSIRNNTPSSEDSQGGGGSSEGLSTLEGMTDATQANSGRNITLPPRHGLINGVRQDKLPSIKSVSRPSQRQSSKTINASSSDTNTNNEAESKQSALNFKARPKEGKSSITSPRASRLAKLNSMNESPLKEKVKPNVAKATEASDSNNSNPLISAEGPNETFS